MSLKPWSARGNNREGLCLEHIAPWISILPFLSSLCFMPPFGESRLFLNLSCPFEFWTYNRRLQCNQHQIVSLSRQSAPQLGWHLHFTVSSSHQPNRPSSMGSRVETAVHLINFLVPECIIWTPEWLLGPFSIPWIQLSFKFRTKHNKRSSGLVYHCDARNIRLSDLTWVNPVCHWIRNKPLLKGTWPDTYATISLRVPLHWTGSITWPVPVHCSLQDIGCIP
jgi:hypothetical protein